MQGVRCRFSAHSGPWREAAFALRFSASRQAAPARGSCCGGRPCGPTALWCSPRGRADNSLRATPFGPGATLRQYRRVSPRSALARADPGAALLVAAEIAPAGCRLTRGRGRGGVRVEHHERCRKAGPGQDAMRLRGAEKRSPVGRARSALQPLTWRICLSAARQRVASYAPGQQGEHRRVVGAADRRTEASRPARARLCLRGNRPVEFSNAPEADSDRLFD